MAEKLFCYVDESGQDTKGKIFIVAVVIASHERNQLYNICDKIETDSQKLKRKWQKTNRSRRIAFVQHVLQTRMFDGKLYFVVYRNENDYLSSTVKAIVSALMRAELLDRDITVLIDGMPKSLEQNAGLQLRRLNISAKKVRGMNDQNDSLIRLADAVCGWVRCAVDGETEFEQLLADGLQRGILIEVSPV